MLSVVDFVCDNGKQSPGDDLAERKIWICITHRREYALMHYRFTSSALISI